MYCETYRDTEGGRISTLDFVPDFVYTFDMYYNIISRTSYGLSPRLVGKIGTKPPNPKFSNPTPWISLWDASNIPKVSSADQTESRLKQLKTELGFFPAGWEAALFLRAFSKDDDNKFVFSKYDHDRTGKFLLLAPHDYDVRLGETF